MKTQTKNEKYRAIKKTFLFISIGLAAAVMLLLVSCSSRHKQAEEIGLLVCESENEWHGTFYDGGPQYPNSGQEVFWLVVCENRAVVISNKQQNPVSTYTPETSSVDIRIEHVGGGILGGGRLEWNLLFCEENKTGHSFSRREAYSANTKGAGVGSLLQRLDVMFNSCKITKTE